MLHSCERTLLYHKMGHRRKHFTQYYKKIKIKTRLQNESCTMMETRQNTQRHSPAHTECKGGKDTHPSVVRV